MASEGSGTKGGTEYGAGGLTSGGRSVVPIYTDLEGGSPVAAALEDSHERHHIFSLLPQNPMELLLMYNSIMCGAIFVALIIILLLAALLGPVASLPPTLARLAAGLFMMFYALYWFLSNISYYFLVMSVFFRREAHNLLIEAGPWSVGEAAILIASFYVGGPCLSFFPTWLALHTTKSVTAVRTAFTVMLVLQGLTKFSMALVVKIDRQDFWPCSWQGLIGSGLVSVCLSYIVMLQGEDKVQSAFLLIYVADFVFSGIVIKVSDWLAQHFAPRHDPTTDPLLQ